MLCSTNYIRYESDINTCSKEIDRRIIQRDGSVLLLMGRGALYSSPYVLDGTAGVILAYSNLPKRFWPVNLLKICLGIARPFAKTFDYLHGLLGITDTVIQISLELQNDKLFNRALAMLVQLKRINDTFVEGIPMTKYVSDEERKMNQRILERMIHKYQKILGRLPYARNY